ncbi:MAG: sugar transferase [Candidatus Paceibacterota bacterium]
MDLALRRERARCDRMGYYFSLIQFVGTALNRPEDARDVVRRVGHRLRITDQLGWLPQGNLALLLSDASRAGAKRLADELQQNLQGLPIEIRMRVSTYPEPMGNSSADNGAPEVEANNSSHSMLILFARPVPWWKRALDLFFATTGLVVLLPLLLLAALLVKLTTPGPALYRQWRAGRGGRPFLMYKFRTMVDGAESLQASLRSRNEQDGPAFKIRQDPRITRVGAILRRLCIDELPQIWNVLRGDMSIVGPRPLPLAEMQSSLPWHCERLDVNPGMTCSWQVHKLRPIPFDSWMQMDIRYARRLSVIRDLQLIGQTLVFILRLGNT